MNVVLMIVLILIMIFNVILHSIGVYLIRCFRKNYGCQVHLILIMNLSIVEILLNLSSSVNLVLIVAPVHENDLDWVNKSRDILYIIDETFLSFPFYMFMIYITIDKLLEICLNIKYPLHVTVKRATCIVIATWITSLIVSGSFIVTFFLTGKYGREFQRYFFTLFDFWFLIIASGTYGIIFYKFMNSRKGPVIAAHNSVIRVNTFQTFKNSRFIVPVMLVISFILFVIVPDILYDFVDTSYEMEVSLAFLLAAAYSIDAFIYIFMNETLRKLLWRKIRILRAEFVEQEQSQIVDVPPSVIERFQQLSIMNTVHIPLVMMGEETV